MVRPPDGGGELEDGVPCSAQEPLRGVGVQRQELALAGLKRARVQQERAGERELPDVVQLGRAPEAPGRVGAPAEEERQPPGEGRDPAPVRGVGVGGPRERRGPVEPRVRVGRTHEFAVDAEEALAQACERQGDAAGRAERAAEEDHGSCMPGVAPVPAAGVRGISPCRVIPRTGRPETPRRMTAPDLPALLSPAEEEIRVVLRALFGRLLGLDAERYSPLYVGPLRRAEPVRRALEDAAASHGTPVAGADALWDAALPGAVGLVPLRAAAQVLRDDSRRRWVVVGDVDPDRLPPEFLARLDEVGLIYDTRQVPAPPASPSPLGAAIAERAGTGSWVLRVAADPEAVPAVAAEAAVRLRLLGYAVGAVWEAGPGPGPDAAPFPPGPRPALVAHLGTALSPHADVVLARRARERGAALVLVGTAGVVGAADPADGSAALVHATPEPVPDAVRAASWPPAREVLTGAPESGAERELISRVDARDRALGPIVRSAASWERPGFLLVFTPECFGWIAVDGGEALVRGAWRVGDPPGAADVGAVLSRIRAMSLWEGLNALFVAATDPLPPESRGVAVLVDTVDLDVRRTLEEATAGRVAAGSLAAELPPIPPSRVARELLWWGQAKAAHELLEAAERACPWGVDEELLLGYLSAERDPREAVARLQHAAHRLSDDFAGGRWSQHVDATLAALLLDVRAHPARARHAWGVVERWIESQGEGWVGTPRRAAVVYELAARAGEIGEAARFRDAVLRLSRPGDALPAWVEGHDPLHLHQTVA